MSGLASLVVSVKEVTTPNGMFTVSGLSLEDVAELLKTHTDELKNMFEGELDFAVLLSKSPLMAAEVIALASGEPEQSGNVQKLPFGVQLSALKAIWDLTAIDLDELGNLFRRLTEATAEKEKEQKQVKKHLSSGSKS